MRKERVKVGVQNSDGEEKKEGRKVTDNPALDDAWRRYKKTRCQRSKELLILEYLPLVKYVAARLAIGLPPSVEIDDLIGSGTIGLLSAVERYDPSRDNKFSTYAIARIRGSMLDELRSMDWIPRSVRKKARRVEEAYARLENRLRRPAMDDEVAKELAVTVPEFLEILDEVRGTALVSLDDFMSPTDSSSTMRIHDTVEDQGRIDPAAALEVEKMRKVLEGALDALPERDKLVIILYYYEELTLKEIGSTLGVSESRVSQIHTKAILRLRGRLRAEREALLSVGAEGGEFQQGGGLKDGPRREQPIKLMSIL